MTIHLNKFIDRLRGQESRGSKDFVMTMNDARDLHADITRLLAELHDLREQAVNVNAQQQITVKLDGGTF